MDFGGKEWVNISSLWQLPDELSDLPPFAICCRLANIEPVTVGDNDIANWSQEATDFLMKAAYGRLSLFTAWLDELHTVGCIVRYVFFHMATYFVFILATEKKKFELT